MPLFSGQISKVVSIPTRVIIAYTLAAVLVVAFVAIAIWVRRNTVESKRLRSVRRDRTNRQAKISGTDPQ